MIENNHYKRLKKLKLEEVLPFVQPKTKEHVPRIQVTEGESVKAFSVRLRTFKNGTKCVACGIEGKYFYAEKAHNDMALSYHLNLYAVCKNGSEMLMTKDHIIPKSKGGSNSLHNMQTMCIKCNQKKGNGDDKQAEYCGKAKLYYKKNWSIKLEDLVSKTSRKKFQSGNRVEKVIKLTTRIIQGTARPFMVLTNCSEQVPLASVNNDKKELILMQNRDTKQNGVKNV